MTADSNETFIDVEVRKGIPRTEKILTTAEHLIGHANNELRALYRKLGYDHSLCKETLQIVTELKSLSQAIVASNSSDHPSDPTPIPRFTQLFSELKRLVKEHWALYIPKDFEDGEDLRGARVHIAELQKALKLALREASQHNDRPPWWSIFTWPALPGYELNSLAHIITWWIWSALKDNQQKQQLDDLLSELVDIRRTYGPEHVPPVEVNDIKCRALQIVDELRSLLRTAIPDFPAFQRTLDQAIQRYQQAWQGLPEPTRNDYGDLLKAIYQVRDDYQEVVTILNKALLTSTWIYSYRNFCEKTVRVWPIDSQRFAQLLSELERLVEERWLPPPRCSFCGPDDIRHIQEALQPPEWGEWGLIYDYLNSLEDDILRWETYAPDHPKKEALAQAKRYLSAPWMQTLALTTYILRMLLNAELVPLMQPNAASESLLKSIYSEVGSGYYDSTEVARRLQRLEDMGLYVNSLIYSLLRLASQQPDDTTAKSHS